MIYYILAGTEIVVGIVLMLMTLRLMLCSTITLRQVLEPAKHDEAVWLMQLVAEQKGTPVAHIKQYGNYASALMTLSVLEKNGFVKSTKRGSRLTRRGKKAIKGLPVNCATTYLP